MSEEKEQRIIKGIIQRAKEVIKYGTMPVKIIVQDGHIMYAEFQPGQETIKIG